MWQETWRLKRVVEIEDQIIKLANCCNNRMHINTVFAPNAAGCFVV